MTYCLAMKLKDGIVGIADTRIISGNECTTARKVSIHQYGGHNSLFIMTSGLRSVRDKVITYFEEIVEQEGPAFDKVHKAVNVVAGLIRRVHKEDGPWLKKNGVNFNINALVAGQMEKDEEHKLFMLYPEGNWIEVGETTPFFIIGNPSYGKPILHRVLNYHSTMEFALKAGFFSFDSTRKCANDVYYPIDVVLYKRDSFHIVYHRYHQHDLHKYSIMWQNKIAQVLDELPEEWMNLVFDKLKKER